MSDDPDLIALLRHLYSYGYLSRSPEVLDPITFKPDWQKVKTASRDTIIAALDGFSSFNGLPSRAQPPGTAIVAADDAIALMGQPRCGIPEFAQVLEVKWRLPAALKYWDDIALPGFERPRVRELVDFAFAQWAAVCGVYGTRVLDRRQANIVATARAIDGPGGTLAYAYMPSLGNPDEQRDQVFDPADAVYFKGMDEKNFLNCYTHELGHSLGFPHGPNGACNLSPYLVPQYWAPHSVYDIPTAVESYGPPLGTTDPDEPPPPSPPIDPQPAPSFVGSGVF